MLYFKDTWSILRSFVIGILWTFGTVRGNLVYFFSFWYFVPKKSGNPGHQRQFDNSDGFVPEKKFGRNFVAYVVQSKSSLFHLIFLAVCKGFRALYVCTYVPTSQCCYICI
jgi:hypothetical protein